jgi:hypothetical protein
MHHTTVATATVLANQTTSKPYLDDQLHPADVQAACSNVGGHQHAELAAAEASQRRLALRLSNVAVQRPAAAAAAAAAAGLV